MSKLSTLIKTLELLKGLPEDIYLPLPWLRKTLLARLDRCTDKDIVEWHEYKAPWIVEANCQALKNLCHNVFTALLAADYKVRLLAYIVRGNMQLPREISHRLVLIWALIDVQDALMAFEVMHSNPELAPYHINQMALRYLDRAYELMLLLGQLLYPPGSDVFWFSDSWRYLKNSELRDFTFDGPEDYLLAENPTLAGVLADCAEVPEWYLPANPEAPVYYRNQGPYGPTILKNYRGFESGEMA